MVVHLNGPGRAAVGVAPDESFRSLKTPHPIPPLCLSLRVLYMALIFRGGHNGRSKQELTSRVGLSLHTDYLLRSRFVPP